MKNPIFEIFPLEGEITQEIIDTSHKGIPTHCIGSNTMCAALGENVKYFSRISWATDMGHNNIVNEDGKITDQVMVEAIDPVTKKLVNLMHVIEPRKILFYILKM